MYEKDIQILKTIAEPPYKLIEHLKSLQTAYNNKHYINCTIIIRAILDYIPPIFGHQNVTNIISSGTIKGKTFKNSLKGLNDAIRNIADDAIHSPARKGEIIKVSKTTIDNQEGNLGLVITECIKQLQKEDLRDTVVFLQTKEIKKDKTILEYFEQYIEKEERSEEYINDEKRWICKRDELYQIHEKQNYGDFSEERTKIHPDKFGSGKHSVHLTYNNNIIKEIIFIYCDGGRISIALPKIESDINKIDEDYKFILPGGILGYYLIKKSLEYKLTKLIGSFYIYKSIEELGIRSKIMIK